MKPIRATPPPTTAGADLANLQDALLLLLSKGILELADSERVWLPISLEQERRSGVYGDNARRAVAAFQKAHELTVTGEVDDKTAAALNAALRRFGRLDDLPRIVSGRVRDGDGNPLANAIVRAFHVDSTQLLLGERNTDLTGRYVVHYAPPPGVAAVDLLVVLFDAGGRVLTRSEVIPAAPLNVTVDLDLRPVTTRPAYGRLEGRIVLTNGGPAEGVTLRLVRPGFGGARALLGETTSDAQGSYALPYPHDGTRALLELLAPGPANQEHSLWELNDDPAAERTILNVIVPADVQPLVSEHQRLTADLQRQLGAGFTNFAKARETATQHDLSILNRSTGWDARVLALAANAARLATDAGLPQEGLYGLFRVGLPTEKSQLAHVSVAAVELALNTSNRSGITSLSANDIASFTQSFASFARDAALATPAPGSTSTYGQFLAASGLSAADRATFADLHLRHRGDDAQLWASAAAAGISDDAIRTLQRQGQFAYLTTNNAPLTERIQAMEPAQLVENDLHTAEKWKSEVRALVTADQTLASLIPPAYTGATPDERLDSYAADMARKVRVSFPNQVVARTLVQDTTDTLKLGSGRAASAAFLTNPAAQEFRLGQTPVATFLQDNAGILDASTPQGAQTAETLKTLQRVYQLTPSTEAMTTLLSEGLTSAADVVAIPRETFIARYAHRFPTPEQADLVHRKAEQISAVTYNLFTLAKQLDSSPPMHVTSAGPTAREDVKSALIKQFPTMETLFGSLDFCQCEHCQSILSPAAYFVDLLQFLEPQVYEALTERRPDLPQIELTCENTLTAMPYIDVVNEVLEYFVANDTLDAAAARDTGRATTAELLAEPQYVIAEAYHTVRRTRYPLGLPFDLWIESVRSFAAFFDTPLSRILHVFRRTDVQTESAASYDRAAVIESLGLSPVEHALFTDPKLLDIWFELYGYDSAAEATTSLSSAKTLSRRLELTYDELLRIVTAGFVNPNLEALVVLHKLGVSIRDVVFYKGHKAIPENEEVAAFEKRLDELSAAFAPFDARAWMQDALEQNRSDDVLMLADPDAGCDFDGTTLQYAGGRPADDIALLRVNLFVRLWRKLGWTIEETDRALTAFVPRALQFTAANVAQAPLDTALLYLAHLKTLVERLRLGRSARLQLLTLWTPMATTGANSLYAQLFLTRGILASDPVFDDPLGQYLSTPHPLSGHLLAVQAALGLTANEIEAILVDRGDSTATVSLTVDTISLLYRHRLLAKALRLPVQELLTLRRLSGRNPFRPLHAGAVTAIAADSPFSETLQFVEIAERIRDAGLKIPDLDALLRGQGETKSGEDLLALVKALGEGVRAIRTRYAVPDDPSTLGADVLRQQLGLVLPPAVVDRFLAMLNGTSGLDAADARAFFDRHFLKSDDARVDSGFLDAADFDLLFSPPPADATAAQKQERLARAFLPFLQKRLIRTFIVQTIAAQLEADPALTEALLTDERLLGDPLPLDVFVATEGHGVTASFFAAADGSGDPIETTILAGADTTLHAVAGANSARFSGYLEAPASGFYRLFVALDKKDAAAELRFEHLPLPLLAGTAGADASEIAEVVELKAGVPYRVTLAVHHLGGGGARLLVHGQTIPKGSVSQLTLYPASNVDAAARALVVLANVSKLLTDLGLSEREIRYLATHPADFDGLRLGNPLFGPLLRLIGYARLKRDLAGGREDLIGIFEASSLHLDEVYPLIAAVTRRDTATVRQTAERLFAAPRFADERAVERLWDALQVVERVGVPVSEIVQWTNIADPTATDSQRFAIARGVREALKARFDEERWRQIAQPVSDKLRRRQRDALVAYVRHRKGFSGPEQLYEYFLLDPGMEPVVRTSRIRLAIASVQLFIQRCLLNLEQGIAPTAINAAHWEWMKRYRVWEANRKIFLYPENWLEPEFRDDKTPQFRDLESALLQGDVSADLAEDAFFAYLQELEELARLEAVGMYCDDHSDPGRVTLHVIGRTFGEPHKYFYRRYARDEWTPWEAVTADVEGDHLAPIVWRDRLYLFWFTFVEKANKDARPSNEKPGGLTLAQLAAATSEAVAEKLVDAQLHWSAYVDGEWSARESGVLGTVTARLSIDDDVRSAHVYAWREEDILPNKRGVRIHLGGSFNATFLLAGRHSVPEHVGRGLDRQNPYENAGDLGSRFRGQGDLVVTFVDSVVTGDGLAPHVHVASERILQSGTSYSILPCSNATVSTSEIRSLFTPFFYQDNVRHTFLVEPTVREKTLQTHTGWIPPRPLQDPRWELAAWWDTRAFAGVAPQLEHAGNDDGGAPFVNRSNAVPVSDWLVNGSTVLRFDGEPIGPAGHAALGGNTLFTGGVR